MNRLKIATILLFLICSFVNGQNFKELYAEQFQSDWKKFEDSSQVQQYIDTTIVYRLQNGKSPKQTLLDNAKDALERRADQTAKIISKFKINFQELDSFAIVEHRSTNVNLPFNYVKKGALIVGNSIYGFKYDLEKEEMGIETYNYFMESEGEIIDQAKHIIGKLITTAKSNYLDSLAKVESDMLAGPLKELRPETEFEVLIYKKQKNSKFKRVYLHETFVQILNQQ